MEMHLVDALFHTNSFATFLAPSFWSRETMQDCIFQAFPPLNISRAKLAKINMSYKILCITCNAILSFKMWQAAFLPSKCTILKSISIFQQEKGGERVTEQIIKTAGRVCTNGKCAWNGQFTSSSSSSISYPNRHHPGSGQPHLEPQYIGESWGNTICPYA